MPIESLYHNEEHDEEVVVEDPTSNDLALEPKIEAQRERLLQSIHAGDFSTTLTRVAGVLNMYPDTRNSDVSLALMYWDIYQPELFDHSGILPKNLFKLERMTNITRARAKIQNEFKLFVASATIQRGRKKLEQTMQEEVLENPAPSPSVWIYADETGKNGQWLVIGSIWILNPRTVWELTHAIENWRKTSPFKNREIHFSSFGRRDLEPLREYLAVITQHREYLGIKYAAVQRSGLQRSIEEAVIKLHELALVEGLHHEVRSSRVELPRYLHVTIDEEDSLDSFAMRDAKERVNGVLQRDFGDNSRLDEFVSVSSKQSPLVQLADVVSGAINRKLNGDIEVRNHKDEMADLICHALGIALDQHKERQFDATTIIYA